MCFLIFYEVITMFVDVENLIPLLRDIRTQLSRTGIDFSGTDLNFENRQGSTMTYGEIIAALEQLSIDNRENPASLVIFPRLVADVESHERTALSLAHNQAQTMLQVQGGATDDDVLAAGEVETP